MSTLIFLSAKKSPGASGSRSTTAGICELWLRIFQAGAISVKAPLDSPPKPGPGSLPFLNEALTWPLKRTLPTSVYYLNVPLYRVSTCIKLEKYVHVCVYVHNINLCAQTCHMVTENIWSMYVAILSISGWLSVRNRQCLYKQDAMDFTYKVLYF